MSAAARLLNARAEERIGRLNLQDEYEDLVNELRERHYHDVSRHCALVNTAAATTNALRGDCADGRACAQTEELRKQIERERADHEQELIFATENWETVRARQRHAVWAPRA